jgi:hypothetical protein
MTSNKSVEYIYDKSRTLAIIIRASFKCDGIKFFTPNEYSQQLAYMNHPKGYQIKPHIHKSVPRNVEYTKEVLIIKSGILKVDFFDDDKNYLESKVLNPGDVILLAFGGHGFEMLESTEIIEVKQGPYAGVEDKVRFERNYK